MQALLKRLLQKKATPVLLLLWVVLAWVRLVADCDACSVARRLCGDSWALAYSLAVHNLTPAAHTTVCCRLQRALNELGSYRRAEGRSNTPDFEEEDRLRADLNTSEAQKRQLGQDSRNLAGLVLQLAAKQGTATASGTTPWAHQCAATCGS